MKNTSEIRLGDTVLYPELANEPFKVVGIKEQELEVVGDFSGVGHTQQSWIPAGKLEPSLRGKAKYLLKQLWDARNVLDYVLQQGYTRDYKADVELLSICRKLSDSDTIVVSAFPGCGKSYFFENSTLKVLDSDSSKFDKANFPANYIQHIQDNIGKVDVIFVSSHEAVRKALVDQGIPFALIYPSCFAKDEYLERYKKRGSPDGFIKLISDNWDNWLDDMKSQKGCFRYSLGPGKYLTDLL